MVLPRKRRGPALARVLRLLRNLFAPWQGKEPAVAGFFRLVESGIRGSNCFFPGALGAMAGKVELKF